MRYENLEIRRKISLIGSLGFIYKQVGGEFYGMFYPKDGENPVASMSDGRVEPMNTHLSDCREDFGRIKSGLEEAGMSIF